MALPKLNTPKYNLNVPSSGKDVEYRPYLVREEKILMIAMESEDTKQMSTALLSIIDSCTEGLDIKNMAMFDVEYIFAKLRAKSVGETSEVSVKCEKCEADNKATISLDSVSVTDMPTTKIELTPTTGLIMRFPSMKAYEDIENKKTTSNVDKIFSVIVSCIQSIYDGEELFDADSHTKAELGEFIESLNSEQFKKVQEFLDAMPQAYVMLDYICEACGEHHNSELKGMANFFA
jgi:hypothetical protein